MKNARNEANFFEEFSGTDAFIKPASKVSAIIFEANEMLLLAM